jgi:hypothetical protein
MSYDILSSLFQNVLKFYQQLTGEERRIPFIFDDFHFCRSRVIGLDMTENRIFTLCRMINWVVFLRIFWNFISSLQREDGPLNFWSEQSVMFWLWKYVGQMWGARGYILVSCAHSNTSLFKEISPVIKVFFVATTILDWEQGNRQNFETKEPSWSCDI